MDIIVTTPKHRMAEAAAEAEACKRDGGGEYFRRFPLNRAPRIKRGERVYYVEDGYVRGFAVVSDTGHVDAPIRCATTGYVWPPGFYVYMRASTWRWIRPLPMRGFQGFRYARPPGSNPHYLCRGEGPSQEVAYVECLGGWLDPKPEVNDASHG